MAAKRSGVRGNTSGPSTALASPVNDTFTTTRKAPLPGTYALLFSSAADRPVLVGQLGRLHVCRGFYVYIGSAFGPGGVQARVAHHRAPSIHPHWHIDYIQGVTQLQEIWWTHDLMRREHQWADLFKRMRGASIPLRGFGSSDCACESHFYFLATRPSFSVFRKHLRHAFPDHGPVHKQNCSLQSAVLFQ
jgi:Uri superfamily endonuclease